MIDRPLVGDVHVLHYIGNDSFGEDLEHEFDITHPASCQLDPDYDPREGRYACGIQFELDNIGTDAFGWNPCELDDLKAGQDYRIVRWCETYNHFGQFGPETESGISVIGPLKCDRCGNYLEICGHDLSFKEKMKSVHASRTWMPTR